MRDRLVLAAMAVGIVVVAVLGWAAAAGVPSVPPAGDPACRIVELPPWENLRFDDGVWTDSHGQLIGYAEHEDTTIWNRAGCPGGAP